MLYFALNYYGHVVGTLVNNCPMDGYINKGFLHACEYHDGQWRRNNQEPYVAHSLRVAEKYRRLAPDVIFTEDAYVAGLLHDVVEDCGVNNAILLKKGFTPRTVELVAGLTRYPWEAREEYIARILDSGDLELLLLKLADVEDNMQVNPFNLSGFKDWRASIERYQKTQKKLITYIGELIERDYIKSKLEK